MFDGWYGTTDRVSGYLPWLELGSLPIALGVLSLPPQQLEAPPLLPLDRADYLGALAPTAAFARKELVWDQVPPAEAQALLAEMKADADRSGGVLREALLVAELSTAMAAAAQAATEAAAASEEAGVEQEGVVLPSHEAMHQERLAWMQEEGAALTPASLPPSLEVL